MIKHTVVFSLKYSRDSPQEKGFLKAAALLAAIPGVKNFESLKQVSPKNNYDFGLAMEFASQELYDRYSSHPAHVQFIQQYWIDAVKEFLEIDYVPLTD
jgi:Stress responsive A/B Barrel Domain